MKIKYLIIKILIILLSLTAYAKGDQAKSELTPIFAFFYEFQSCTSCNFLPLNTNIIQIEKYFPNSRIYVFIVIADSSLIDSYINSKIKTKNIYFVTSDDFASISKYFIIDELPAMIMFNYNGDELIKFSGEKYNNLIIKNLINYVEQKNINSTLTIKYPIGIPETLSFNILDSLVYYVDMQKNEIGVFGLYTCDSINTTKPDDFLQDYSLSKLDKADEIWLNERLYPITNFRSIIPKNVNSYIVLVTNISGISTDTSFITQKNSIDTNLCKIIKIKNILAEIEHNTTIRLDTFYNNEYSIKYLKRHRNGKYSALLNLMNKEKYNKNKNLLDSVYLIAFSNKPTFDEVDFVLSYKSIMDYYSYDSVNLYSIGLLEYSSLNNSFYYLNPFMKVFFQFNNKKIIKKITPKGLLKQLFQYDGNLKKFLNPQSEFIFDYYLMEWFIHGDNIDVLILPRNKKKFTDFFVINSYDLDGNFKGETYFFYTENDKIFRVHFFGDIETEKSYFAIQSKLKKWQLMKFNKN